MVLAQLFISLVAKDFRLQLPSTSLLFFMLSAVIFLSAGQQGNASTSVLKRVASNKTTHEERK